MYIWFRNKSRFHSAFRPIRHVCLLCPPNDPLQPRRLMIAVACCKVCLGGSAQGETPRWNSSRLDGALERRNEFFDVWRQLATALHDWPQRNGRRRDDPRTDHDRVEVVVQMCPPPAMLGIA
jgi:hypothetical protein